MSVVVVRYNISAVGLLCIIIYDIRVTHFARNRVNSRYTRGSCRVRFESRPAVSTSRIIRDPTRARFVRRVVREYDKNINRNIYNV